MKIKLNPLKKHQSSSSSITELMINNQIQANKLRLSLPNPSKNRSSALPRNVTDVPIDDDKQWNWNMDPLSVALPPPPFTHSSRSFRANVALSEMAFGDDNADDHIPPDFARASAEFYTPTYQAMKNSTFFSNKNRSKSRRLSNASTLYESTIGIEIGHQNTQRSSIVDGLDPEALGLMTCVPEEMSLSSQKRGPGNATPFSANCEDFSKATPVNCQLNHRPKPLKEFMDEVQSQKQRDEVDASRKENYNNLLKKLRIKEDAIDAWESKQKNKAEDQLEKLERTLEKKRAKAVQRAHKKLVETEQEAEKRKLIARNSVLKEMTKLQIIT